MNITVTLTVEQFEQAIEEGAEKMLRRVLPELLKDLPTGGGTAGSGGRAGFESGGPGAVVQEEPVTVVLLKGFDYVTTSDFTASADWTKLFATFDVTEEQLRKDMDAGVNATYPRRKGV